MTRFYLLLFLLISILLPNKVQSYQTTTGYDPKKETCPIFGKFHIVYCEIRYGFKLLWRQNSIAWSPEQTRNMTFEELKKPCDQNFACKENSGCFQDFVNFQFLDQCIDDMFVLGPMELCEEKLKEVLKKTPDQISECVKKSFADKNPEKFDCVSIKERGECFLADVEKHCDSEFFKIFKEHQDLRLYNRACDGRLRYKDWDYSGSQDFEIRNIPGGVKIVDPKRNVTVQRNLTNNLSYILSVLLASLMF